MKKSLTALALLLFFIPSAHAQPTISEVTPLDTKEIYLQAQVFHAGYLWVGRSRDANGYRYQVEIYEPKTLKLLHTIPLNHSATYLHAYGAQSILVMGRTNQTHYTIITLSGNSVRTYTYDFGINYFMDTFGGDSRRHFFAEPGSRAIFEGTPPRNLGVTIYGPGQILVIGSLLYVLERQGPAYGDENIVRVDTNNWTMSRLFTSSRNGLTLMLPLRQRQQIALSESVANQVLLLNADSGAEEGVLSVAAHPRALVEFGNCLVVGSREKLILDFFDLSDTKTPLVETLDLSAQAPAALRQIVHLDADRQSKTIFVRAIEFCLDCTTDQSGVFAISDLGNAVEKTCLP